MKSATRNYVKYILLIVCGVAIIFAATKIVLGTGNPFYVVSSGSMVPTLHVYDMIMVQTNIPFDQIKVGDIIAFKNPQDNKEVIVHRVAQILNQNPTEIRTKGDANPDSIPGVDLPLTKDDYVGKVAYVIPQIGFFTLILAPPMNYVAVVAIMGVMMARPLYKRA